VRKPLFNGPSVAASQPACGTRLLTRVSPRRAGLLFPHAEFASWLAYGNGERPLSACCAPGARAHTAVARAACCKQA